MTPFSPNAVTKPWMNMIVEAGMDAGARAITRRIAEPLPADEEKK